jgi:hypothetical protein
MRPSKCQADRGGYRLALALTPVFCNCPKRGAALLGGTSIHRCNASRKVEQIVPAYAVRPEATLSTPTLDPDSLIKDILVAELFDEDLPLPCVGATPIPMFGA